VRSKEAEELKVKRALERKLKAEEDEKKRIEEEKLQKENLIKKAAEDEERKLREAEEKKREKIRKVELRKLNDEPRPPKRDFFKALNSKANKCGTFPKKLASLTRENYSTILKEYETLNLSRYVPELVTHIVECPLKSADVFIMAEMCSAIHQRYYPEFVDELIPAVVAQFDANDATKAAEGAHESEVTSLINKRRTALRLVTELFLCGIETNLQTLQMCVSNLIKKDPLKKSGNVCNLMLLLSFVRRSSAPILGIVEEGGEGEIIVEMEMAKKFRSVFDKYFDGVCEYLVQEYKKMKRMERYNKEQLKAKGLISDNRKEEYEKKRAVFEKLLVQVQQFAEALKRDMPALVEDKVDTIEEIGTEVVQTNVKLTEEEVNSLWADEEIRSFYEDLPDLVGKCPGMLLGLAVGGGGGGGEEEAAGADEEEAAAAAAITATAKESEPELSAADEAKMESAGMEEEDAPKPKTPLDIFMASLNDCFSVRKADDACEEFCTKFNDKRGRNRLVEALFDCPRTKLELIPRFCRIAATLNQYPIFKNVVPSLLKKLESQFFYLLKRKNQLTLEGKLRNIRFLGEMVNFQLCPADLIFRMLGKLLDEFVHHNVEVAVALLEVCGRFLYRSPGTHIQMRVALDRMMRIKETKSLDERLATAVDNAFYHCNPPETPMIVRKERSPTQKFIRFLIFRPIEKETRQKVVEGLRRLDWKDLATQDYVVKCCLKLSKGQFGSIPHLAYVVAQLAPAHEMFVIKVVDGLLEQLRLCLEDKKSTEPQSQIMNIKFLGELFKQNIVDSRLMFDTLYTIIILGVSDPNKTEDSFRVRLVCALLDCVSKLLCKGSGKDRLKVFVQYFQRYMLALTFVQIDLYFAFNDCLERLPVKCPKFRTLRDASQAIRKLEGAPEVDPEQRKRDELQRKKEEEEKLSEENRRLIYEEKKKQFLEEKKRREQEERDMFDRELAMMMSEKPSAGQSSRGKGLKNMAIPMALLGDAVEEEEEEEVVEAGDDDEEDFDDDSEEGEDESSEEKEIDPEFDRSRYKPVAQVQFKVLMRKGAKVQARDLAIPEDNLLAQKVKERKEAEEIEREEITKLVLQKAELVSEDDGLKGSHRLNKGGIKVKEARPEQQRPSGPPTRALGSKF
jgi:regulator of nonsense transcripts 2